MKDRRLEELKKEYMDISIPKELDFMVKKSIKDMRSNNKDKNKFKRIITMAASTAAAITIFILGINTSSVFAETLSKVPVIGEAVKLLTFKSYSINEGTYKAEINVPSIQGLENKTLENSLNEKYLKENQQLYSQFMADMKDLKEKEGGHLGVNSGFIVKTDSERIFSIGRYVVNTVGSSSTTFKYDTIDKQKEVLITLPSLFKDESYVTIISENIKEQMRAQYKLDNMKYYWVEGVENKGFTELFEKISKEQNFYINAEGKLVISFDKYEVAPGYMGVVEFVIPTEILRDILVGNEYIR